jgi:hypothetical protein
MVSDARGEFPEVWYQQDHHTLPNIALVPQPVTPVGKEIIAGSGSVEIRFPHNSREIAHANLTPGEGFSQYEV